MKKIISFVMLSGIIAMSACGNKTATDAPQQDSVETTDTVATDSLGAAGQTGEAAEQAGRTDQTVQANPNAKSIEAGGTTITVGAPLAETLKKAKGGGNIRL